MSLKTLHAGARGTWIYQSPRITLLLIYAEAKGLDPRAALQRHLQNVERLGPHQTWILERLQWLGYRTERGGPPNLDALRRYQEALGLNPQEVAQAIDSVLEVFRSRPEDAVALPPLLTLPEKLVVVKATASSKFQLGETLRHLTKPAPAGDRDAYRREIRFRKSWLYALHLATPHKPTCLGYALYAALEAGEEPEEAYIDKAEELGLLKWIIALEAAALDIGTKTS